MRKLTQIALCALYPATAVCDMYWQFPPGSNNRLNEPDNDRDNDKRVFDSQNNDRDGFNINHYDFYAGSEINLAWTLQHSCGGDSNVECQTILQYACKGDDSRTGNGQGPHKVKMRDGRVTDTIGENAADSEDPKYGMHENYQSYQHCKRRERNQGLFPADQLNPNQNTNARFTRQDNQGTRYAYECPEERDYYPYWMPSMWKDIAVLVDDTENEVHGCEFYQAESENVKARSFCYVPDATLTTFTNNNNLNNKYVIPIDALGCQALADKVGNNQIQWKEVASHGIDAPACVKTSNSKDNHHGNAVGSRYQEGFKWMVPDALAGKDCAIRLRYNMSSPEIDNWSLNITHRIQDQGNKRNQNIRNIDPNDTGPDLYSKIGFTSAKAIQRGYKHLNDQQLYPMPNSDVRMEMSYNTDQLARTFQDRTYMIKFKSKPNGLPQNAQIHNLNAAGKIGTNVENYPNFEYDYHPQNIVAKEGDFVHIQFSGASNYDSTNDAAITDELGRRIQNANDDDGLPNVQKKYRINVVPTKATSSLICQKQIIEDGSFLGMNSGALSFNKKTKDPKAMTKKLAFDGIYGGENTNEYAQLQSDENYDEDEGDMKAFHVDFDLIQLNEKGKFSFMSTHNNRFGANVQKGKINVN